ncbi:MAG: hypothetical protein AAGA81_18230, partial [Acidobacteriota bacterium]
PSSANASSPPNIGDDSYRLVSEKRLPLEILPGVLLLMDRNYPEAGRLQLSELESVNAATGRDFRAYQWLADEGWYFLSETPWYDLWAQDNASGAPPIDHVTVFEDARRLVATLADWSRSHLGGRFVISPFYRPLKTGEEGTRACSSWDSRPR